MINKKVKKSSCKWKNGKKIKTKYWNLFCFLSDEFYLKAECDLPPCDAYEDFTQYENGVGMLSLLEAEFAQALKNILCQSKNKMLFLLQQEKLLIL